MHRRVRIFRCGLALLALLSVSASQAATHTLISGGVSGEVQDCLVVRSSGNVQYDSSCINAIMRTSRAGDFPPPPTPEYQNLEMVFTLNELRQG